MSLSSGCLLSESSPHHEATGSLGRGAEHRVEEGPDFSPSGVLVFQESTELRAWALGSSGGAVTWDRRPNLCKAIEREWEQHPPHEVVKGTHWCA